MVLHYCFSTIAVIWNWCDGRGYSWGGFESLAILQELKPSKDEYSQGRRFFKYKKNEHIVRLHIGLEDPKDLITDLKQSLRYIK